MPELTVGDHPPLLVEWSAHPGTKERIAMTDPVGEGRAALESAMQAVEQVAAQAAATINRLAADPQMRALDRIEIEFGLKLDAETGAFIAKAGIEAQVCVKLIWQRPERPVPLLPNVPPPTAVA